MTQFDPVLFKFKEDDRVTLSADVAGVKAYSDLKVGVVWCLYDIGSPAYEVIWTDVNGEELSMPMDEEELVKLDDPDALNDLDAIEPRV